MPGRAAAASHLADTAGVSLPTPVTVTRCGRVRMHLMRLHAELNCAKQVLRLTDDKSGNAVVAAPPDGCEGRRQRLQRRCDPAET